MAGSALLRIRNIVKAEIDDLLSHVEGPKKMVNQMLIDVENAFDAAVGEVSRAIANEKIIERRVHAAEDEIRRLQLEAEGALGRNDEPTARRCLDAKVSLKTTLAELTRSHDEAQAASARLKTQLGELRTKLDSARNRKETIAVRKHRYQAEGTASSHLDRRPFDAFDRLVSDVDREEIASEVYEELSGDLKADEPNLEKLERDRKVKEELESLKNRTKTEAGGLICCQSSLDSCCSR